MASQLSILLSHYDGVVMTRYALKADSFIVQISKSPIQIPVPQASPILIDFGIFRPSITLSGLVDDIGGDPSNTDVINSEGASTTGMELVTATDGSVTNGTINTFNWYIPYKNKLEESLYTWMADDTNVLTLQIGDPTYPIYDRDHAGAAVTVDAGSGVNPQATGGAKYIVALQQLRFQVDAGREDRWIFQMQFVAEARFDAKTAILS